jgi:hypothetical protein
MRYIKINDAKPGMRLAYNIYDADGHTLICKGSALSEFYVKKLNEYGFSGIYIADSLSDDIVIEPIITPELRTEGLNKVRNSDVDGCKGVSRQIVNQILHKGVLSLDLKDLRSFDGYTYAHSVNVAVISCIIGFGLKLNSQALEQVVMAGLLHDLGKQEIPQSILNKPTRLTNDEYKIMKTHSTLSYEMIKDRWDIRLCENSSPLPPRKCGRKRLPRRNNRGQNDTFYQNTPCGGRIRRTSVTPSVQRAILALRGV